MLFLIGYLVVTASVVCVVVWTRGEILTPAILFLVTWAVVLFLATRPGFGYLPISPTTWLLFGLAAVAVVAGSVVAGGLVTRPRAKVQGSTLYDDQTFKRAYTWMLAALVGSLALDLYRVIPLLGSAGGLSGLLGGQGLQFREAQIAAASEAATTDFSGGSLLIAVAGYLLFIGYASVAMAGYLAARGEWRLASIPLVLLALFSIFTLQRFVFVYSFLIFLFSMHYHRALLGRRERGSRRPVVLAALVVVAVVFIPLQLRGQATTSAERYGSVIDYVTGGIVGLNNALVTDVAPPGEVPGYGAYTFYGAASIGKRLGAPIDLPPNLLRYSSLSDRRYVNGNVGSFMIYPYYDAGVLGVGVLAFLLGVVSTALHRAVLVRRRALWIMPASIACTTVVMSFFGLSLVRDLRWMFLVVVAVLFVFRPLLRDGTPRAAGVAERRTPSRPAATSRVGERPRSIHGSA